MTFGDLLTYEENCVKEALSLPHLNVRINVHSTYSDCETCGSYSTVIFEVYGDLGETVSGDYAGCLSRCQDGEMYEVAQWLNERLIERGRPVPELLSHLIKDAAENDYYEQAALCNYDYNDSSLEPLAHIWGILSDAFEAYYEIGNIARLYAEFGVEIEIEHEEDPIYYADDWYNDDYDNEEEEECQED